MTQQADIFIEQGADWEFDFPIDNPTDLTGATAAMEIRTITGATYIATLLSSNGTLIINPSTQTITGKIPHGTTAVLVPGEYVYDMLISDSSNALYRAYEGSAIVDGQVTRVSMVPPTASNPITTEDGINITTEDGTRIAT